MSMSINVRVYLMCDRRSLASNRIRRSLTYVNTRARTYTFAHVRHASTFIWANTREQIEESSAIYQCRKNRYYPIACRQNDTLIDKGHIRTTENFLYECSELTPGRLRLEIVACRMANLSRIIYPGERVNISSEVTATCEKIPTATTNGIDRLKLKVAGCIDFFGVYVADGTFFTSPKGVNTTCDVKGDGVTMESLSHYTY
uniref:Abnormal cell migration protein 18-like fibronectin type I domain-containing protein n=1 Tax=Romanomermis culicivorax TaxID=13658 RepID=A0A915KT04_ROMCU